METQRRATVYFEAEVHRALRRKAEATRRSVSEMVNEAVKLALAEDVEDLAAFEERNEERGVSFESVVQDLRGRGRL
jgi:hypothetical protein